MDNDEEDFKDDSVDSNMELVRGKVAQKDDGDESLSQDDLSTMPTADFDGPSEMPKKGRERTNSRVSVSAPWVSGLLKSHILPRMSMSGSVLSIVLKKLQEVMMLKHAGSMERRPSLTLQKKPTRSADFASNQPLVPANNSADPVEAPILDMYSDQGSNSFGSSDLGWDMDELIDSLLNFDVLEDAIVNMYLWSFDDMPIDGIKLWEIGKRPIVNIG
ncbi:hypothetical protein D1007_17370 [Hordeum vulgare]|nr:hypothetical protein D1007_17370 [Hordeum vulgare]